jgi:hypothetical protein
VDQHEIGSTGSVDAVSEDPDAVEMRPIGHMGKSSSVAWAQRTRDEFEKTSSQESLTARPAAKSRLPSHHTEDADIRYVINENTLNELVSPPRYVADALVPHYFTHVHNVFPIMDKLAFESWLNQPTATGTISEEEKVWKSTLNWIFAIAAYHAHLTNAPYRGVDHDHLEYCARAKKLLPDEILLGRDARLTHVRATGLQCLYYICTGRLNRSVATKRLSDSERHLLMRYRAWNYSGLAIRQAVTLGLHVRSKADDVTDVEKENRLRAWWSIYSSECLLTEMTGRPSSIANTDIGTPLPINESEDEFQPGRWSYRQRDSETSPEPSTRSSPTAKGPPTPVLLISELTFARPESCDLLPTVGLFCRFSCLPCHR